MLNMTSGSSIMHVAQQLHMLTENPIVVPTSCFRFTLDARMANLVRL